MPHSRKPRLGIVLAEALVAIATLAMGVLALGTITQNSIATTVLAKDYLVARGLAKEGEEAVKNIRLTNWMLKPAPNDTVKCWLRITPSNSVDPNCNTSAATGKYYISILSNGIWTLQNGGITALDLDKSPASTNQQFVMYLDPTGYSSSLTAKTGTGVSVSKFYRSVYLTNLAADNSAATFNIKVQWKDGAKTMEINRSITMYNYL